ncbi:hypothetical protein PLESTM_001881000 [Pleodorina starrii]|nr:hypothetical protein PLESTM_001881000 [Pleodorina starrii]
MSVYGAFQNESHFSLSYLVGVPELAVPLRGWRVTLDPRVVGDGLDVGGAIAVRTAPNGSQSEVRLIPSVPAASAAADAMPPTLACIDDVTAGSIVLYNVTFRTVSSLAAAGHRRRQALQLQLQRRQRRRQLQQQRGYAMPAIAWTSTWRTGTTLPAETSGPSSAALAPGLARCGDRPTNSPSQIGAGGCISTIVKRSYSPFTNLTTVTVGLYGNGFAAPDCASRLAGLPSPSWAAVRLAGAAAVAAVQAGGYEPVAAFPYDAALLVPFRVAPSTRFVFTMSAHGAAAVNDFCQQGLLPEQLPDTCVVHVFSETLCVTGIATEPSAGVGGTLAGDGGGGGGGNNGGAPVGGGAHVIDPWTSPPYPPHPPPDDTGGGGTTMSRDGGGGGGGGSKLRNAEIALVVCLVVGAVLLAVMLLTVFWHRRNRFNVSNSMNSVYDQTVSYNYLAEAEAAMILDPSAGGDVGGGGGGGHRGDAGGSSSRRWLALLRGRGAVSESWQFSSALLQEPSPSSPAVLPPPVQPQHMQAQGQGQMLVKEPGPPSPCLLSHESPPFAGTLRQGSWHEPLPYDDAGDVSDGAATAAAVDSEAGGPVP